MKERKKTQTKEFMYFYSFHVFLETPMNQYTKLNYRFRSHFFRNCQIADNENTNEQQLKKKKLFT